MKRVSSILLLLTTAALKVAGQAGGWYVVDESLVCTQKTCTPLQDCTIITAPDDDDIANFCKQITDDCADGVLDNGQRSFLFGEPPGILGTAQFGTGPSNGNNGCPNNDDCNLSFKYLTSNMRNPSAPGYPDIDCSVASIDINGYYNHAKTGSLIVQLGTIVVKPP